MIRSSKIIQNLFERLIRPTSGALNDNFSLLTKELSVSVINFKPESVAPICSAHTFVTCISFTTKQ